MMSVKNLIILPCFSPGMYYCISLLDLFTIFTILRWSWIQPFAANKNAFTLCSLVSKITGNIMSMRDDISVFRLNCRILRVRTTYRWGLKSALHLRALSSGHGPGDDISWDRLPAVIPDMSSLCMQLACQLKCVCVCVHSCLLFTARFGTPCFRVSPPYIEQCKFDLTTQTNLFNHLDCFMILLLFARRMLCSVSTSASSTLLHQQQQQQPNQPHHHAPPPLPQFRGPKEYCYYETFDARCPDGEVVVMTTAVYGRMRFGRCE